MSPTDPDRGQSEPIGVILLTGIVVVTVAVAGGIYLSTVADEDVTRADLAVSVATDELVVAHRGGDPVALADLRVVVDAGGNRTDHDLSASQVAGDGDDRLEPGERWVNSSVAYDPDQPVHVLVVDTATGTRLAETTVYPEQS